MGDLLTSLEQSAFCTWLREGGSIWGYPTVLTLHTVGLAILVGANFALALRVLGAGREIPLARMRAALPAMWVGFVVNAVSGIILFLQDSSRMLSESPQLLGLKLVFVAAGMALMWGLNRAVFRGPVPQTTPAARVMAAASVGVWIVATAFGRFMAYPGLLFGLR